MRKRHYRYNWSTVVLLIQFRSKSRLSQSKTEDDLCDYFALIAGIRMRIFLDVAVIVRLVSVSIFVGEILLRLYGDFFVVGNV